LISEETFAQEEKRLGKQVHFHDGVSWVRTALFYFKPVHEFRPFPPKSARPHPLKALLGYSHQVPDPTQATRCLRQNVLEGENLRRFSLDCLKPAKRRAIRRGLKDCVIELYRPSEQNLEHMRLINISQAKRFEGSGESGTFQPAEYYELHATQWREGIIRLFSHQGHQFIGAFVGDTLAAYVDLIQVEDTWIFGAVKSCNEYLQHRPVDALYFSILSMASQSGDCSRVVNGGPDGERKSLTYFKEEFLLRVVSVPYYSRTFLPMERLRSLQSRITRRRQRRTALEKEAKATSCAESQES